MKIKVTKQNDRMYLNIYYKDNLINCGLACEEMSHLCEVILASCKTDYASSLIELTTEGIEVKERL